MAERPDPKIIIETLIELQGLEIANLSKKTKPRGKAKERLAELREKVPETILGHHDRMVVRGKKSTIAVYREVCGACFIALPSGEKPKIALGRDIHLCQNCGVYLYVDAAAEE